MKHKQEFEKWFLSLNRDFSSRDLSTYSTGAAYFYTTTQALYDQFCTIKDLTAQIKNKHMLKKQTGKT